MLRVSQIRLRPDHTPEDLKKAIAKKLRIGNSSAFSYRIIRQSIDARKKPDIFYVYTADVHAADEKGIRRKTGRDPDVTSVQERRYEMPAPGHAPLCTRPVIIGSGPAGLFCALLLARAGYRPLVIERGEAAQERVRSVQRFWDENRLNTDSNVQFGEGGAGTFSDGKLNTSIKDPQGRIRFVLETFVKAGADEDILYSYKPHIGTDRLRSVVTAIRREITDLGGEFRFSHRLEEIRDALEGPKAGAEGRGSARYDLLVRDLSAQRDLHIAADVVILALGHSARDTFEMLLSRGVSMQPKAFAVGVRIQHPQKMVDEAMYGKGCPYEMPPAPYKLTCQLEKGGVYSFCMCPGGYVVNASSEPGMTAVNGMSFRSRGGENANSAIVMTVSVQQYWRYLAAFSGKEETAAMPEQIPPLAGMEFARELERRAWRAGKGYIPAQTFGDFCADGLRAPENTPEQNMSEQNMPERESEGQWSAFAPGVMGKYVKAGVRGIFPEEVSAALEEGIRHFDRVIPGFASPEAFLCAPESRTSSPVRICRDQETFESLSHPGLYPCGEGAGYAGGITSAAVDGMRVAEAVISRFGIEEAPKSEAGSKS